MIEHDGMGGSCAKLSETFAHGPFNLGLSGSGPSQYSLLSGLASDDVAALKVFLGNGRVVDVALRDNAFLAHVARADFPIRVVGYDSGGRVIGIQTMADDGMTSPAPASTRESVRQLVRIVGDNGAAVTLRAGTPAGGYRCWSLSYTGGAEGGGCTPWPPAGPPLQMLALTRAGGDFFLAGAVPDAVAAVEISFADGKTVRVDVTAGFVLYAVPSAEAADGRVTIAVRAVDVNGDVIAKRGLEARS